MRAFFLHSIFSSVVSFVAFTTLGLVLSLASPVSAQPDAGVHVSPERFNELMRSQSWKYVLLEELQSVIVKGARDALKKAEFSTVLDADGKPLLDSNGNLITEPYQVQRLERLNLGSQVFDRLVPSSSSDGQQFISFREQLLKQHRDLFGRFVKGGSREWLKDREHHFSQILEELSGWELLVRYEVEVRPNFQSLSLKFDQPNPPMEDHQIFRIQTQVELDPLVYVKSIQAILQNPRKEEVVDLDLFEDYNQVWDLYGIKVDTEAYLYFDVNSDTQLIRFEIAPLPPYDPTGELDGIQTESEYFESRPVRTNLVETDPSVAIRLNQEDVDHFLSRVFTDPATRLDRILEQLLPSRSEFDFLDLLPLEGASSDFKDLPLLSMLTKEAEESLKAVLSQMKVRLHLWVLSDQNQQMKVEIGIEDENGNLPAPLQELLQKRDSKQDLLIQLSTLIQLGVDEAKIQIDPETNAFRLELEIPERFFFDWKVEFLEFPLVLFKNVSDPFVLSIFESLNALNLVENQDVHLDFSLRFPLPEARRLAWNIPWTFELLPESPYPLFQLKIEELKFESGPLESYETSSIGIFLDPELPPLILDPNSFVSWADQIYTQFPLFMQQAFSKVPEVTKETIRVGAGDKIKEAVESVKGKVFEEEIEFEYSIEEFAFESDSLQIDWLGDGSLPNFLERLYSKNLPKFYQALQKSVPLQNFSVSLELPKRIKLKLEGIKHEKADVRFIEFELENASSRRAWLEAEVFLDDQGSLFVVPKRHNLRQLLTDYRMIPEAVKAGGISPRAGIEKQLDRSALFSNIFGSLIRAFKNSDSLATKALQPVGSGLIAWSDFYNTKEYETLQRIIVEQVEEQKPSLVKQLEIALLQVVNGGLELTQNELTERLEGLQWHRLDPSQEIEQASEILIYDRSSEAELVYVKTGVDRWSHKVQREKSVSYQLQDVFEKEVTRVETEFDLIRDRLDGIPESIESLSRVQLEKFDVNGRLAEAHRLLIEKIGSTLENLPQQAAIPLEGNPSFKEYLDFVTLPEENVDEMVAKRSEIFSILRTLVKPSMNQVGNQPILEALQLTEEEESKMEFPFQICLSKDSAEGVLSRLGVFTFFRNSIDLQRDVFCESSHQKQSLSTQIEKHLGKIWPGSDRQVDIVGFTDLEFVQREILWALPAAEQVIHELARGSSIFINNSLRVMLEVPDVSVETDPIGRKFLLAKIQTRVIQDTRLLDGKSLEARLGNLDDSRVQQIIDLYKSIRPKLTDEWFVRYADSLLQKISTPARRARLKPEETRNILLYILRRVEKPEDLHRILNGIVKLLTGFQLQIDTGDLQLEFPLSLNLRNLRQTPHEEHGSEGYLVQVSPDWIELGRRQREAPKDRRLFIKERNGGRKNLGTKITLGKIEEMLLDFKYDLPLPQDIGLPLIEKEARFEVGQFSLLSANEVGPRGAVIFEVRFIDPWNLNSYPESAEINIAMNSSEKTLDYLNEFMHRNFISWNRGNFETESNEIHVARMIESALRQEFSSLFQNLEISVLPAHRQYFKKGEEAYEMNFSLRSKTQNSVLMRPVQVRVHLQIYEVHRKPFRDQEPKNFIMLDMEKIEVSGLRPQNTEVLEPALVWLKDLNPPPFILEIIEDCGLECYDSVSK